MPSTVSRTFCWSNITLDYKAPSLQSRVKFEHCKSFFSVLKWTGQGFGERKTVQHLAIHRMAELQKKKAPHMVTIWEYKEFYVRKIIVTFQKHISQLKSNC